MILTRLIAPPGLFRFILALVVVVSHFAPLELGSSAVYLFFALSGYWIQTMWGKEYAPADAPYRTFILSRLWRIFPVYYAGVALWVLIKAALHVPHLGLPHVEGPLAWHFYLSNLFLLGYSTLPLQDKLMYQMWSVDVELQFYFIAPFLIFVLSRYSSRSWQVLTLYGIATAGIVAFAVMYNGPGHFYPQSATLPMFLAFFLIGMQAARLGWRPPVRPALYGVAVAALLVAVCLAEPSTRGLFSTHRVHVPGLPEYNAIANMFVAFLVVPYAMATVRNDLPKASRLGSIDRALGSLSYEVYVLHVLAVVILTHYVGDLSRVERIPCVAAAVSTVLLASWLVYRLIDRPIDALRTAWVRSRRRVVRYLPG
jgi:peptidoglycan/LPS O-acetylase OafA/YrhL